MHSDNDEQCIGDIIAIHHHHHPPYQCGFAGIRMGDDRKVPPALDLLKLLVQIDGGRLVLVCRLAFAWGRFCCCFGRLRLILMMMMMMMTEPIGRASMHHCLVCLIQSR